MIDASVDGMFAFDRDCRLIAWNRAMQRISGFSRNEVLGKRVVDVFPFLREGDTGSCFSAALAGKEVVLETHPYAETGVFESSYSPLLDEQNNVIGVIAVIGDISARKQAEEATRRLEFHVESSPLAVVEWDSDFRVSRWSASAEHLFGWKAEDVLGKHVNEWRFVFTDDVDAVALVTNRQREGVEVQGVQRNRNYTREGSILYCEWYNSVLRDERGKLVSVLSLVLDVTARQSAEDERAASLVRERDARRHAEEADRLKDEFLATLSHELRTPLNTVVGYTAMLRKGMMDLAQQEKAVEVIQRNAQVLTDLVGELLDTSRIITGKVRLDIQETDLSLLATEAVENIRPSIAAKGLQFGVEIQPGIRLLADRDRLRQVMWNLLSNAVKFTPTGGRIEIEVFAESPSVHIVVRDTGIGLSSEALPHIFKRFWQGEPGRLREYGGLGLGLSLSKYLTELHGGSIAAASAGQGKGSEFRVSLPLRMAQVARAV